LLAAILTVLENHVGGFKVYSAHGRASCTKDSGRCSVEFGVRLKTFEEESLEISRKEESKDGTLENGRRKRKAA
jgi:hypothetical protein